MAKTPPANTSTVKVNDCSGLSGLMPARPAVGSKLRLATNLNKLSSLHPTQSFQDPRNQRTELLHTICSANYEDYSDSRSPQVLLKREVLVDGEQSLEPSCEHELQ